MVRTVSSSLTRPSLISLSDMDEECYPAISMNAATNGHGPRKYQHTTSITGSTVIALQTAAVLGPQSAISAAAQNRTLQHHTYAAAAGRECDNGDMSDEDSEDSSSDSEDDVMVKKEPLSPGSSCPPSPVLHGNNTRSKSKALNNINLSQIAALTNTDLVFEHNVRITSAHGSCGQKKLTRPVSIVHPQNGSMHLSQASKSLLKSHNNRIMSKLNIKMEPNAGLTGSGGGGQGFNLPLTPASSVPSDDSEGNQSPEHSSPMSPPISTQTAHNSSTSGNSSSSSSSSSSSGSSSSSSSPTTTGQTTTRRSAAAAQMNSSSSSSSGGGGRDRDGHGQGRHYMNSGASSRQPIHTPLISSQPVMHFLLMFGHGLYLTIYQQ